MTLQLHAMSLTIPNEIRLRIAAVREQLEEIHTSVLVQITDAASAEGDMDWVQHCAKQVELMRRSIRDLDRIEETAIEVLQSTLSCDPDPVEIGGTGLRKLTVTVTEGMINQHLLTLTEARNQGKVSIGEKFTIRLPDGTEFATELCEPGNRLRERGAIRRFYEQSSVGDGDRVVLQEASRGNWTLSVSDEFEALRKYLADDGTGPTKSFVAQTQPDKPS